ncbi:hypothetical protein ABI59_13655 [Acidobacteria bacterium Mor1]|nr:hypothetical protein ABI59_13655 [Acidobacteria bacterium Mor1]
MKARILIVEDNPGLAFGLRNNLELEGYRVEVCTDGREGLEAVRRSAPDLVILDLMLPGMDGLSVLDAIRKGDDKVPVLVLTARGEESDKVLGLRTGADDYVTKPFGLLELIARVEALLRRSGDGEDAAPAKVFRFGAIEIEPEARTVLRGGMPVELAPKEFDLLLALVHNAGRVRTRQQLLDEVWGYAADVVSRTVDTHIGELRRKLEKDPSKPRHILTARKAGYRWVG